MTYITSGIVSTSDFMGFRGNVDVASPYSSSTDATNKVAALIGVGYGDRGYGQLSTSIPLITTGLLVKIDSWNSLLHAVSTINTHTGSNLGNISNVSVGNTIVAYDGSLSKLNLPTIISTLDNNRLQSNISDMSLTAALTSSTINSWNTSIYHEFTVQFINEDSARFFFNTGGQVVVSSTRGGGSNTGLNTAISNMLNDIGYIRVSAKSTNKSGPGTSYNIGYYNLTGTYQNLFTITGSNPSYSTISYVLSGRTENISNVNGGNGYLLRFRATFATGLGPSDIVDGNLQSNAYQYKSTGVVSVTSPIFNTTVPL